MAIPVWTVQVDWGNVGTFAASGDDISGVTLDTDTVTIQYGRDQSRALAPPAPGTAQFLIDNASRTYSPDNTASTLAPNVLPARRTQITAVQNSVTYVMYMGYFDTYDVSSQDHVVSVGCVDALARFSGVTLSTALLQGVTTGQAIGAVLDAAGWPSGLRALDPGSTQIRWWWEEGTDALTALQKLIASEGPPSIAFVDGPTGNFVFKDRQHRLLKPASLISNAGFIDGGVPESPGAQLIPAADSGFEVALTGNWVIFANVTSITRDTVTFFAGAASLKFIATASGTTQIVYNPQVPAFGGQPFTLAAEIHSPVSTLMNFTVFWQTPLGGANGSTTIAGSLVSGWNAYSAVFYPPPGTGQGQAWLTLTATGAAQAFNVDVFTWTTVPAVLTNPPFTYDLGWSGIVNSISVSVDRRDAQGALSVVWQYSSNGTSSATIPGTSSDIIVIPSGGTAVFDAQASGDPFTGAIVPVAGADFVQISGTTTASLNRTSGQSAVITLTDSGGGSVISGLQLRALTVPVVQTTQISLSDATSVTANGMRSLPSGTEPVWANANDALAISQAILLQRKARLPVVSVTLTGGPNTTVLTQQLARDLSDRVTITEFETGLQGVDFYIEQIQHQVSNGGAWLATTFSCEKVPPGLVQPFIFDDPVWGLFDTGGALGI